MNGLVWILQEVNVFLVRWVAWIVTSAALVLFVVLMALVWWAPTPNRWVNRRIGQAQGRKGRGKGRDRKGR